MYEHPGPDAEIKLVDFGLGSSFEVLICQKYAGAREYTSKCMYSVCAAHLRLCLCACIAVAPTSVNMFIGRTYVRAPDAHHNCHEA